MFSDDDDLEATRIGQASDRARPWRLVLGDGRQLAVSASPLVLGRGPVAPPTHPDATPIVVVDPVKSVSKSHALVLVDGGMLWVTDMHSTNGTKVTNELGEATSCPPGVGMPAGNGWTISLGEYSVRVVLGDAAEEKRI
jgi:pSer/pThr/pTyr-binding forkhead associated (FHA) protein